MTYLRAAFGCKYLLAFDAGTRYVATPMTVRDRILEAASQVYAETGYRGATTRRIAQAAGVSEITLFRHFGSKDALIKEALGMASCASLTTLPATPADPERELREWCRTRFEHLHASRALIRKVMGEIEEHPEITRVAKSCPSTSVLELREYVSRLRERGLADPDAPAGAATAMLIGALFADAVGRDIMTEIYDYDIDEAIAGYVRLFLRAIGASPTPAPAHP
jgi:AcrR family transcriptional regulator